MAGSRVFGVVPRDAARGDTDAVRAGRQRSKGVDADVYLIVAGDFDAEAVQQSLAVFANTSEKARDLFPEGTETGGDTEALPTVWSDAEGFQQGFVDFSAAVAEAQAADIQSVEQLQPQLQGVLATCRDCHKGYRVEQD